MRADLPDVRRCCFCFPLRHGLLVMGLLKTLVTVLLVAWYIYNMAELSSKMQLITDVIIESVLCACLILDICCTVVFLIGGCMKNERLMRMYYVSSIVMQCTIALLLLWRAGQDLVMVAYIAQYSPDRFLLYVTVLRYKIAYGITWFGIQTYMIVLIKNEIEKLNKIAKSSRFTNASNEEAVNLQQTSGTPDHATDNQLIGVNNQSQNTRENVNCINCNQLCDENVAVY